MELKINDSKSDSRVGISHSFLGFGFGFGFGFKVLFICIILMSVGFQVGECGRRSKTKSRDSLSSNNSTHNSSSNSTHKIGGVKATAGTGTGTGTGNGSNHSNRSSGSSNSNSKTSQNSGGRSRSSERRSSSKYSNIMNDHSPLLPPTLPAPLFPVSSSLPPPLLPQAMTREVQNPVPIPSAGYDSGHLGQGKGQGQRQGSSSSHGHGKGKGNKGTAKETPQRRNSRDEQDSKENGTRLGASKSSTGKNVQAKQSWLAVASAVAHSAAAETNQDQVPMGDDSKPTKYHYYPHNQHLYLLPECATQQVCSAVYLRLNYSQPLCACPNFHEPCSVSTRTDDRHTIPLVTGSHTQALTLVKTCEPTQEVRECRAPKDWSILALQNSRTGKAHYLVICRCPAPGFLEGPIAHSQPAYARVPGIRVYGMTCVRTSTRTGRLINNDFTKNSDDKEESQRGTNPVFPWNRLKSLLHAAGLNS